MRRGTVAAPIDRRPAFDLASFLEVLRAACEPIEPKRALEAAIVLDVIRYIYSGGSVETIQRGFLAIDRSRRIPKPPPVRDPAIRSLLPRLRCASIAAHVAITPRLRNRILNLPSSRTMENLRCFLFWGQADSPLANAITKRHFPAATEAYRALVDSIAAWSAQRRPEKPRTPWIVPNRYLRSIVDGQLDDLPVAAQQVLDTANEPDPVWRTSLPRLTLGAASTLGNMQSTALRALYQALSALVRYMNPDATSTFPWDAEFPTDLRPVPTYAMFPFRAETTVRRAITNLETQEIRTLGDLRCLHPQVIRLAKEPTNHLVRLYAALDEASEASTSDIGVF